MNNNQEDREIQELMKDAPLGNETPSRLRSKLQSAAVGPRVRHASPAPGRWAMAGIAAVAIIAIGVGAGVGLNRTPNVTAQAKTFAKVINATNLLDAFQLVIRANDMNTGEELNIAFSDGKFNMSTKEGMIMRVQGPSMEFFDPKKNEVVEMNLGGMVDPKEIAGQIQEGMKHGMEEFDVKKMLAEMEKEFGKENVTIGPIQHKFGRSTYDVTLEKPHGPERIYMTVDAEKDIPIRIRVEKIREGAYQEEANIELRFGNDIDPDLVITDFPANAKRVKLDFSKMMEDGMKGLGGDMKEFGKSMKEFGESFKDLGKEDHSKKNVEFKFDSDVKIIR